MTLQEGKLLLKQLRPAHLGLVFLTALFTVRSLVLLGHGGVLYDDVVKRIRQLVQALALDEEPALQLLQRQPHIRMFNLLFCNH